MARDSCTAERKTKQMRQVTFPADVKQESTWSPQLLWPGLGNDTDFFPPVHVLRGRQMQRDECSYLEAFLGSIARAEERVWIIDRYLGKKGIGERSVMKYVGVAPAKSIRVISKYPGDDYVNEIKQRRKLTGDKRYHSPDFEVEWRVTYSDFPDLHDRFVIIDDELWHFGGSVGCGEEILTAASRGWSASETGARDRFNDIWMLLKGREA